MEDVLLPGQLGHRLESHVNEGGPRGGGRPEPGQLGIDRRPILGREVHPHRRMPQHERLAITEPKVAHEGNRVLLDDDGRHARGDLECAPQSLEALHMIGPHEGRQEEAAISRGWVHRMDVAADALDDGRQRFASGSGHDPGSNEFIDP